MNRCRQTLAYPRAAYCHSHCGHCHRLYRWCCIFW